MFGQIVLVRRNIVNLTAGSSVSRLVISRNQLRIWRSLQTGLFVVGLDFPESVASEVLTGACSNSPVA
jgi:hypothetical protein